MPKKNEQKDSRAQPPKLFGMSSKQMKQTAISSYLLLAIPGLVGLFIVMGWSVFFATFFS